MQFGSTPEYKVFDADVVGSLRALEAAIAAGEDLPFNILLNNQAATRALDRGRSNSSQAVVDKFSLLRHYKRVEIR